MNIYKYVVKDEQGKTYKGKVEARDERQAITILRSRKLVIVSLTIADHGLAFGSVFKRISSDDLVQFTQQLSTMLNSGLPPTA